MSEVIDTRDGGKFVGWIKQFSEWKAEFDDRIEHRKEANNMKGYIITKVEKK
jgi:hypothetical protein